MAFEVLCLRPEADFARVDALPPASLQVTYGKPDDPTLPQRMKAAAALVIPAVGPKLAGALFEGCSLRLVQITGAGVDRLDEAGLGELLLQLLHRQPGIALEIAVDPLAVATIDGLRSIWT